VAEACEYDRSFLNLQPKTAAILNIESDHLDYYSSLEEIVEVFAEFAGLVAEDGLLVANADDAKVAGALAGSDTRCEYYSVIGGADWYPENLTYERGQGCFDLWYRNHHLGRVQLKLAGRHNVSNALAVAALARSVGLDDKHICTGLERFEGVGRRMSYKGMAKEALVLDDYAHHPTEIQVTLEALRAKYNPRRLWCVFQPHQHSRTRFLLEDFALSFEKADVVLLPDIYFVRDSEETRRQISAQDLADKIKQRAGQAYYLSSFAEILEYLDKHLEAGDLVVSMGAGDVWKVADELVCGTGRDS
jgi:UDP-N-acetylmuramate--alanine ligase